MEYFNIIADCCERVLDLKEARLSDSYFYRSLPLCTIDAVFSIRAKYETTMGTVGRYCDYFHIKRYRTNRQSLPEIYEQQSVSDFLRSLKSEDVNYFAGNVFKNRQRTAARNGILKSDAVFRFASVLDNYAVNYFQDMHKILSNGSFEEAIKSIPGQRSGISLKYFFMLAGSDDLIKPDMHIINFLNNALANRSVRSISLNDAQAYLSGACDILKQKYPHLTPRLLDYTIWSYQRKQKKFQNAFKGGTKVIQDLKPTKRMPNKGDLFKGKVNDLVQYDACGWRRRDISFYKCDTALGQRFDYPSHDHQIVLIDTAGNRYELNVTEPDNDYKVCLGTPSRLKAWYQRKGFDEKRVAPETWIFFQYSGYENEFLILTEKEKDCLIQKIDDVSTMKTMLTWAGISQFNYSGSVKKGTKINYGGFSTTISAAQYSALLKHFQNKTVDIGTSHTKPPINSVGEWLQKNVTKTGIASYVGPILISENYAVKIGGPQIKFIQKLS